MSKPPLRTRLILDLRDTSSDSNLSALLNAGDVACALLSATANADIEGTVGVLQAAGVAALVCDDVEQAIALNADGVHITARSDSVDAYATTRAKLPDDLIVGCEIGPDRHVAMVLAEAGADYVAFQVPERQNDLLWWAEIFEVPCVAMGTLSQDDAVEFARSGVEFISASADEKTVRDIESAIAAIELVEA